eukprot:3556346-Rhodomonas_salina.4
MRGLSTGHRIVPDIALQHRRSTIPAIIPCTCTGHRIAGARRQIPVYARTVPDSAQQRRRTIARALPHQNRASESAEFCSLVAAYPCQYQTSPSILIAAYSMSVLDIA